MNPEEMAYLNLLQNILTNGSDRSDRTGVGTKSIFGSMLRFSLEDNVIPILTTKKTFYRGAIEEMLFFIRGETDTKKLEEKGVNIWKGNTSREFLDSQGMSWFKEGSMGLGYGHQWRYFSGNSWGKNGVDQLARVFKAMQEDPNSRRHIVSAWSPKQLKKMAVPPCHYTFQFYIDDGMLSCLWNQRSVDAFLGLPFNITGYSILTHLFAKALGLKAKEVIFSGGDVHVYNSHIEQVKEQLTRAPYKFPTIKINKELHSLKDIEDTTFEDLEIVGYQHHAPIHGEMAL